MILGISTQAFTLSHVVISLIGIVAGLVVLAGMLASRRLDGWTALFLGTTVLTSVTGFFFPRDHLLPSHIVGILSLAALALALAALYGYRLAGPWRRVYVVTAIFALYLNIFVAVVQAFAKIPVLHAMAPAQSDLPFIVAQLAVIVIIVGFGIKALRSFHPSVAVSNVQRAGAIH